MYIYLIFIKYHILRKPNSAQTPASSPFPLLAYSAFIALLLTLPYHLGKLLTRMPPVPFISSKGLDVIIINFSSSFFSFLFFLIKYFAHTDFPLIFFLLVR